MSNTKNRYTLFIVAALAIILLVLDPFGFFKPSTKPPIASIEPEFAAEIALDTKIMAVEPKTGFADLFDKRPLVLYSYTAAGFGLTEDSKNFLIEEFPLLTKKGVHNIIAAFLLSELQPALDKLLSSSNFDENAAKSIILKSSIRNQFKGNMELLKAVWTFNKVDPSNQLRVWASASPEKIKYSFFSFESDEITDLRKRINQDLITKQTIDIINNEILGKKEKALILENELSVVSKFKVTAFAQLNEILGKDLMTLGQKLSHEFENELYSVITYSPWPSLQKGQMFSYPFGTIIDASMSKVGKDDRVQIPCIIELSKSKIGLQYVKGTMYNYSEKVTIEDSKGTKFSAQEQQIPSILMKDFADYLLILTEIQSTKFSAPMTVDDSTIGFYRTQVPRFAQTFGTVEAINKQNDEYMMAINKSLAEFGY